MRIIGTIEARMGSSRLPGKTMASVFNGMPLLECVVRRFQQCQSLDGIVIATTMEAGDDVIAQWGERHCVSVFRGSEENVLERVVGAALQLGADAIVQMGADSAYLDYELIDRMVARFRQGDLDYLCNDLKLTFPLGIYAHVVRVSALLEIARRSDLNEKDRSDVVRYIWEHAEGYRISNVEAESKHQYPELRLTIDYPEDLEQAKAVYSHFGSHMFSTDQILKLYCEQPEIFEKTRHLIQQSAPFLVK